MINILTKCKELHDKYKIKNEDYDFYIYDKCFELGKKDKNKLIVFDMDETLISACFDFNKQDWFNPHFTVHYENEPLYVRKRPYLDDILEKLS